MSWEPWSRRDEKGLARYVSPEAKRWLPLEENAFDVERQEGGRRRLAKTIYDALLAKGVRYALEEYHPSQVLQNIRTPAEVLISPRQGTCLDLAALYCGLCLAYELLPLLIVIEGHALAAVSLTHGLRQRSYRPDAGLFQTAPLTDAAAMRSLVAGEQPSYLAVECTGFAQSQMLGRASGNPFPESIGRANGVMTFDRAITAGREQLEGDRRPPSFALDVATARFDWRIEAYSLIYDDLRESPSTFTEHLRTKQFEPLVKNRTRDFVGRDFIFQGIDNILQSEKAPEERDFTSGYIVITGEPGIGKTALMCQLVKTRGYVHHFNISLQGITSTADFLGNVCAQLIVRYGLPHAELPDSALKDSGFLVSLLSEAAAKSAGKPVVVLVDALDEAQNPGPGTNPLLLPPTLPEGVYFIVTRRPESAKDPAEYRIVADRVKPIFLNEKDPQNREDVRSYVTQFVNVKMNRDTMTQRLAAWGVDEPEFVDVLTEKSEGNFMYLVYVLPDIREKKLNKDVLDDIHMLPSGLKSYYGRYWVTIQAANPAEFIRLYKPIVCQLAVAREAVPVDWLAELTKLPYDEVTSVLETWSQFLNIEQDPNGTRRYRLYHASFRDFLGEEVQLKPSHNIVVDTAAREDPGTNATNPRGRTPRNPNGCLCVAVDCISPGRGWPRRRPAPASCGF